mmetsp:Transcript_6623/g.14158  ORF Transcript_6623/g.14158 Transcript_6623/m.14158 type:complete len:223 (-) Transcript_6623:197-865(-)
MVKRGVVGLMVVVAVCGMSVHGASDLDFKDLPCGVTTCEDGVELQNEVVQTRFASMLSGYVNENLMTQLKATTLVEFFYSALSHGPSGPTSKCFRDEDTVRVSKVLKALVPPPKDLFNRIPFMSRAWHSVKSAVGLKHAPGERHNVALEESSVRNPTLTTDQCYAILTGSERYCEVITCATLTGSSGEAPYLSQVTSMYWTCCQTYYSSYYGYYCSVDTSKI